MKKISLILTFTVINLGILFCQLNSNLRYRLTNIYGVANSSLNSVLIQDDGKIISGGWNYGADRTEFLILRYNSDGSLDKNFGFKGIVLTGFNGELIQGRSLALQSDGKILMAGYIKYSRIVIFRYNNDGSIDNTFGTNGHIQIEPRTNESYNHPFIAIQEDSKIIVSVGMMNLMNEGFVMFRFNSNGSLDNSFGNQGRIKRNFAEIEGSGTSAYWVKLQTDGKIVLSGMNSKYGITARYNPNGSIDTSFGNNGAVMEDYFICNPGNSLIIQPNGKILVAGTGIDTIDWYTNFTTLRYNTDGTLDNTFSNDGKVITKWDEESVKGYCATLQTDGKIVFAGSNYKGGLFYASQNYDIILSRYNSNGTPDNTFGTNGIVISDTDGSDDVANSIVLQADNKILIAGFKYAGNEYNLMMRFNTNGEIDTSFNKTGRITIQKKSEDVANSIILGPDSKIIVAGSSDNTLALAQYDLNHYSNLDLLFGRNGIVKTRIVGLTGSIISQPENKILLMGDSCLSRFNSDGSSDNLFGVMGLITFDSLSLKQAIVQPDRKIVVSGFTTLPENKFTLLRFTSDGLPDISFGSGGKVITDFSNNGDYAYACVMQQDGKIILAGDTKISDSIEQTMDTDFALARYNTDGTPDNLFGIDGKITTTLSNSIDHCSSIALQPDGKILCTGTSDNSFVLIRYNSNGDIDTTFGTNGTIISSDIGHYGNKVLLQSLEKILVLVDSIKVIRFNLDGTLDEEFHRSEIIENRKENEGLYDMIIQPDGKIAVVGAYEGDFLFAWIPSDGFNSLKVVKNNSFRSIVYPNPTYDNFTLALYLNVSEKVSIILYDDSGRIIKYFKTNEHIPAGAYKESFTLDKQLSPGTYILNISTQHSSSSIKMIKK